MKGEVKSPLLIIWVMMEGREKMGLDDLLLISWKWIWFGEQRGNS